MISFVAVIWLFEAFLATAAPYVVTSYIEVDIPTVSGAAQTITNFISPTASPLPTALSTVTISDQAYSYLDVVEIFLPSGAGSVITTNGISTTSIETDFYVPITYHPFSTCSGQKWTYITTVPVYVPVPAQPFLTPLVSSTSATSYTITINGSTQTESYPIVSALLNPIDVPSDEYSSISSANQPDGVTLCINPTETETTASESATATVSSYGITCGQDNPTCEDCTYYTEYCYGDCAPVVGTYLECEDGKQYWITGGPKKKHVNLRTVAIAVPAAWGGFWLLMGIWLHQIQFRNVMQGRNGRLGGLPMLWGCLTLWSCCFIGRSYAEKSSLEQSRLAQQWRAASWWKKVWWYFRWGWGWKYPPMLGTTP